MTVTLTVVGDALLDRDLIGTVDRICPDAPVPVVSATDERSRPGGAGLAAVLATRGRVDRVRLVTALGVDRAGVELSDLLRGAGVEVVDLGLGGATAEKIRVRAAGQSIVRIDRGDPPAAPGPWNEEAERAVAESGVVLVADYGRGVASAADARRALALAAATGTVVWDPHPRGTGPVPGCRLVTPNSTEARAAVADLGAGSDRRSAHDPPHGLRAASPVALAAASAGALVAAWQAGSVAITLGRLGAVLVDGSGAQLAVPAPPATGDPCGAGDCFAAAAATELAAGALVSEAVAAAVAAASAFVAAGGAGSVDAVPTAAPHRLAPPAAADARSASSVVVAAGGCFDLLHAGHVAMLTSARALGDRLVVLVNSDRSVRRLKGPSRPLQTEADRAAVLAALDCVDEVVIFDEDTPQEALARLRPQLFVKGGDYAVADLPEARTMAAWGGTAVTVPYLSGRSTTRLVDEATRRSAPAPAARPADEVADRPRA